MRWIALLRAVNVGGRSKVPMAGLRGLFEELGFADVRTYIASGNVVFEGTKPDAARIERAIADRFGVQTTVILRSAKQLAAVLDSHPFGSDTGKSYVTFLVEKPSAAAVRAVRELDVAPDEVAVVGREVYLRYPNGLGRSKTPGRVDRALRVAGTNRNWRTVEKLVELSR
jgi:uncharacterized protein (DUF1697 family)